MTYGDLRIRRAEPRIPARYLPAFHLLEGGAGKEEVTRAEVANWAKNAYSGSYVSMSAWNDSSFTWSELQSENINALAAVSAVPEPATLTLFALSSLGLLASRRRKR